MCNISLKFSLKNGYLFLCALKKGSEKRHYRRVPELKSPNLSKWNVKEQKFMGADQVKNNMIIYEMLGVCEQLANTNDYNSGAELFHDYEAYLNEADNLEKARQKGRELAEEMEKRKNSTLGHFLRQIIAEKRNPTARRPSANFQPYETLLHKMEKENYVIHTPINAVSRDTLQHFSDYLLAPTTTTRNNTKSKNYLSMMKVLITTLNKARKAGLTNYIPAFPYRDYAPVINKATDKAVELNESDGTVRTLSEEQYNLFLKMDLRTFILPHRGEERQLKYYEMYRDFCILLYEMKSRPMDIMKLHWDNIAYNKEYDKWTCSYIPSKKKNHNLQRENDTNALSVQFLSPTALAIMNKYKDQSNGGYIFPFACNEHKWNLEDANDYIEYYVKQNRQQGKINLLLHRIGERLGLSERLTLYTFRRTAITHALKYNKMPLNLIAKIAGTSTKMIENHYTDYLETLAAFD